MADRRKKATPEALRQRASRADRIAAGGMPISGVLSPEAAADLSRIVDKIGCSKLTAVTIALRAYVADRLDKRRR